MNNEIILYAGLLMLCLLITGILGEILFFPARCAYEYPAHRAMVLMELFGAVGFIFLTTIYGVKRMEKIKNKADWSS